MGKKKAKNPYKPKTNQEIKELALDMFRGDVITDRQIVKPGQDSSLLFSVFLPLALSGPELADWLKENNIDLIYGRTSDTFGRSINGWHVFSAMAFLNKEDTLRLIEAHDKIQKAIGEL